MAKMSIYVLFADFTNQFVPRRFHGTNDMPPQQKNVIKTKS